MDIYTEKKGNAVVVRIKGKVDADTAPSLEECFTNQIAQNENKIIVNLEGLDYISSAGLRVVLAAAKNLKALHGELLFVGLKGSVEKVFKISGFYSAFKIFDTEETALAQL